MNSGALLATVGLLLANGLFVAAEFAFIAARRTMVETRAAEGHLLAGPTLWCLRRLSLMLSGAQLGITMASLGLGHVAEPAVAAVIETAVGAVVEVPEGALHTISLVIALTIVVFLHMVVGEMAPKNIAIAEPERSAFWLALPMRGYTTLLRPAVWGLTAVANSVQRLLGVEPRDEIIPAHTAEELRSMVAESRREGLVHDAEHLLLSGALRFADREVSSIMVPRARIDSFEADTTIAEAEALAADTGHSRFPVFAANDRVVGFVHAKDLLTVDGNGRDRPLPEALIRPLLLVPSRTKLQDALLRMRRNRIHMALVTDDAGAIDGLVSLEDILEVLVGQIRDEHDVGRRGRGRRRRRRQRG